MPSTWSASIGSNRLRRARTGHVPAAVEWRSPGKVPGFLEPFLVDAMADRVAWKFAPLRVFADRHELALDNDRILRAVPRAIGVWLGADGEGPCVIAEDVRPGFGQSADLTGPAPRNSGIRGLPPGLDRREALRSVLSLQPAPLASELDEQGLQVAAVSRCCAPLVVSWTRLPSARRSTRTATSSAPAGRTSSA